jgi:hypothetical protein
MKMEYILSLYPTEQRAQVEPRISHVCTRAQNYVKNVTSLPIALWGGATPDDQVIIPNVNFCVWNTHEGDYRLRATLGTINDGVRTIRKHLNYTLPDIMSLFSDPHTLHGIYGGNHYYLAKDPEGRLINERLPGLFESALPRLYALAKAKFTVI